MSTDANKEIIQAAYIGVDGNRYRVRVPVTDIRLTRGEGPAEQCGIEMIFTTWHEVDAQLASNQPSAPKGGAYDKHDFKVTWADGSTYSGRYDLSNDGMPPSLASHIRQFLHFLADKANTQNLPWLTEEERLEAEAMLQSHELQQSAPSLAPGDWPIVRDYCKEPIQQGEPAPELTVYGLA